MHGVWNMKDVLMDMNAGKLSRGDPADTGVGFQRRPIEAGRFSRPARTSRSSREKKIRSRRLDPLSGAPR